MRRPRRMRDSGAMEILGVQPPVATRCELSHAVGLHEDCPGRACPFWDVADGCILGGVRPELAQNPELTYLLLGLRDRLGDMPRTHPVALVGGDV